MASELEGTLERLLQSLLEMGICASDVQESALETSATGAASGSPGGLIGRKATQTLEHLAKLHSLKDTVSEVYIPLEVINFVDQGKNPHMYTRDFVERVAGENMYTNGILSAVSDYRDLLNDQMKEAFPELASLISSSSNLTSNSIKSEEDINLSNQVKLNGDSNSNRNGNDTMEGIVDSTGQGSHS